MLTSRVLPPAEWNRLQGTSLGPCLAAFDPRPERTQILVVEEDGEIVGHWVACLWMHGEGVEIAPNYQKRGAVARLLLRLFRRVATEWGCPMFMTGAVTDDVRDLIESHLHGTKILADQYIVPVQPVQREA